MQEKIKVLALCDYACSTGFATVSRNILQNVYKSGKYEIDVVGINYNGDPYDTEKWVGRIYPAMTIAEVQQDPYGRQKFLSILGQGDYDVVFILQDTFIVQTMMDVLKETYDTLDKKFKTILYFPFDCTPKKEWVEKVVSKIDYPVAYTNYAKQLCVDVDPKLKDIEVIYHGTNVKEFFVAPKEATQEFRKKFFASGADGKFLITNVNRNQSRKDIVRNFMILNELRKRGYEQAVLYLHMSHDDQGGNVLVMADHFGFELGKDYLLPSPKVFNVNQGVPVDMVNMIYNASDCLLTTTLGEGWGLSVTEAMATKTPIVAPNNTSLTEMLADDRGYLVKSGDTPSMWILKEMDNERLRPLMDVVEAADKLELVIKGKKPDLDGAFTWAHRYTWESICQDWLRIFERAALDAKTATAKAKSKPAITGLNRAQRRRAGIK
jgi:glycosyltransferase involved in cell wall biosynthesis